VPETPVGAKRNRACTAADCIAHSDDDDWYAPWRLRYQIDALRESGAGACGLDHVYHRDDARNAYRR
jgi:hypothetical protein